MITLAELNKITAEMFPSTHVTLPKILLAWSKQDVDNELGRVLEDTGLSISTLSMTMSSLVDKPADEDKELLTKCIIQVHGMPVDGWHLLKILVDTPGHRVTRAMIASGLNLNALRKKLTEYKSLPKVNVMAQHLHSMPAEENSIKKYGRDLIELAGEGIFDELCDREDVNRLIEVLMKKQKGNAVITGNAGVGKTALVELLAKRIVNNQIPDPLKDVKLFEISMGKLVAGTIYRGQFEKRMEELVEAAKACKPVILFIDEMHLIWGAGRAEGSPMDAANMLKPVLARGEIRVIGATTVEEYHQYIRKDEALARRFEELKLEEPSPELVVKMVSKQAVGLSAHHKIEISTEIIVKAIELADRYISNKFQPDKSVDLLDSSCVYVVSNGGTFIKEEDIINCVARQTGKNIAILQGDDRKSLQLLSKNLQKQIVGQNHAVDKIVETIIYRRQGIGATERNLGTFLFSGSTGVGKTELARILAREFFNGTHKLLHVDLAEYNGSDAINKLIGAGAGFVGHEKEGVLTGFLHTQTNGVLLFDELEKASKEIIELLLGMIDNGRICSAKGEVLDTRECIIIATTNSINKKNLNREQVGFGNTKESPDMMEMLSGYFPKELLGRFDELILFNELGTNELKAILKLRIDEAVERLEKKNIILKFEEGELISKLLEGLKRSKTGARGIARLLEKRILQPIAMAMLMRDDNSKPMTFDLNHNALEIVGI
ncbi:MAG: ATP-dependent Clp protease ATP-binding subunit [Desulfamplus sp.]|nr:ATP-dependent Clp protease ATP-binding subunit [Desulfamplus sp.]